MPRASSTSSTRRRIASGEKPRFSSTNAMSRSTWSTTDCDSGSCATKPDDVGQFAWMVRARRPAEHHDVAAETPTAGVRDEPVDRAQQRALARARRAEHEQQLARRDVEVDATQRRTRGVGVRERHVAERDRAHASPMGHSLAAHAVSGAGSSAGASNGSSASAGSRWSVGHASGLANHTRLLSPAHGHRGHRHRREHADRGDDPVGPAHPAGPVPRAAGVGRRQQDRGTEADRARQTPSTAATVPASPISATNEPPSSSNDTSPHQPAARSRGLAPARRSRASPSTRPG